MFRGGLNSIYNEPTLEERRRIGRYAAKNSLTKKALQTLL